DPNNGSRMPLRTAQSGVTSRTVGPRARDSRPMPIRATLSYPTIAMHRGSGGSSMEPVTAAIVAGAVAGLSQTASEAVHDAYISLKQLLAARFPRIDVESVEELPNSTAKRASLAEDVARFGADQDIEIVQLAEALVVAISRNSPQAAVTAG